MLHGTKRLLVYYVGRPELVNVISFGKPNPTTPVPDIPMQGKHGTINTYIIVPEEEAQDDSLF